MDVYVNLPKFGEFLPILTTLLVSKGGISKFIDIKNTYIFVYLTVICLLTKLLEGVFGHRSTFDFVIMTDS